VLIEDSPPTQATAGNLYEPMQAGESVEGGMRERMSKGDLRKLDAAQPQDH
jgi:hypothetical protein